MRLYRLLQELESIGLERSPKTLLNMGYDQKQLLLIYRRKIMLRNLLVRGREREVVVIRGGDIMGFTKHPTGYVESN